MTHQDYLIKRGWRQHDLGSYMWVDPVDSRRYTTAVALDRQRERDAANLDTALAALEAMSAMWEHVSGKVNWGHAFLDAKAIQMMNEAPLQAREALAAVKAAREGGK